MRKSMAAIAATLISFAVPCAAATVTFYGEITSFEVLTNGAWVASETDRAASLSIYATDTYAQHSYCSPSASACGRPPEPGGVFTSALEFGVTKHMPDADTM